MTKGKELGNALAVWSDSRWEYVPRAPHFEGGEAREKTGSCVYFQRSPIQRARNRLRPPKDGIARHDLVAITSNSVTLQFANVLQIWNHF